MTRTERAPRRRALVTGLAGFTGRYVAQALEAAGYEVWGTVAPGSPAGDSRLDAGPSTGPDAGPDIAPNAALDPSRDPELARYPMLPADLRDAESVRAAVADARADAIVHLAACSHVTENDPSELYLVNVVGTRHLLAALDTLEIRPRCVLLASSANVYGNASASTLDEQVAPCPANDYALSKLSMEYTARLWASRLPIVIARPFNYTGVGQRESFLLPKLVAHFASEAPRIALGNLDVRRDFSDVRDVAAAYARLVELAPAGRTFNVCSERTYSLKEVLAMLSRMAGYVIDVSIDPRFVRSSEVKTLNGSRAALRACIGELPLTPLDATLRWMMAAARAGARTATPATERG
ncbi:MAG: GDP-6-deoxy-D-talose 4-dehydrogenase [Burkholderia plantarii]|nr:MAG: GDP-6-deoxy-D-talose 4-dehydrogenase [Burkholderia plantarii]